MFVSGNINSNMNKLYNSNRREGIERHRGAHSFLVFATAVQPSFLPANNGSGCIGCGGCCPPPKKLIFEKELIERMNKKRGYNIYYNTISFKSRTITLYCTRRGTLFKICVVLVSAGVWFQEFNSLIPQCVTWGEAPK